MEKNLPANAGNVRHRFDLWVGKIPRGRAQQSTPVFLPGESHWTEETVRLKSTGSQKFGHDWRDLAKMHAHIMWPIPKKKKKKKNSKKYVLNKWLNKHSSKWSQNNNINKKYVVIEMTHSEPHLENWKVQRFWKLMDLHRMCATLCCHFSCVWLFLTSWTVACQAPLSTGFSRQEYWSGLLCPSPRELPEPGIKPACLNLLHWQVGLYH